jgi:hypothetical protein
MNARGKFTVRAVLTIALVLSQLLLTGIGWAQLPVAPPTAPQTATQFDVTGFIQAATTNDINRQQAGGLLTINGSWPAGNSLTILVPDETVVILPANQLFWTELFQMAPPPYLGKTPAMSGMALSDIPQPLTTYEAHVVGNKVTVGGVETLIAGLVNISAQGLNQGQGYINYIDYSIGEMRVGGKIDPVGCVSTGKAPAGGTTCTGSRVRINDPHGKFGIKQSPDVRYGLDPDNPTVKSATGFPMCIPRSAPTGNVPPRATTDPWCPEENRPIDGTGGYQGKFMTITGSPDPNTGNPIQPNSGAWPDATKMAPFEVGDYVTYSGTLVTDNASQPTAGPYVASMTTYVSAHTLTNNIAVYTYPGVDPAYVSIEVSLMGTGGLTAPFAAEAAFRTRYEGFATDPSRIIHLYALDFQGGQYTQRDWGTIGIDQGAPTGAVMGRWRFRPPCLDFGAVLTKPDKQCVMGNGVGVFNPAPREVLAVLEGPTIQKFQTQAGCFSDGKIDSNACLKAGQYHAPIGEYIFPEQVIGNPVPSAGFEAVPFLAQGGYPSTSGIAAAQLRPWPGDFVPTLNVVKFGDVKQPAGAPGDVTIAGIVFRIQKERLVVTAASAKGLTLYMQAFDHSGNALPYTLSPMQMVPVLGIPTLDVVGAEWPGYVIVCSTPDCSGPGFESVDLTKLGWPIVLTSAQVGKFAVNPVQFPISPAIPLTIRSN